MIDMALLAGTPRAADFTFRVGPNAEGTWQPAPGPRSITVRPNAGVGGSSRITITWADGAIRGTWLEVTVGATVATGQTAPDVFLFGNAVGEVGDSATDAIVSLQDVQLIAANATAVAAVTSRYDVNRDGRVNAIDRSLASLSRTTARTALPLIAAAAAAGSATTFAAPGAMFGPITAADVFRLLSLAGSRSVSLSGSDLHRWVASAAGED